MKPDKDEQHKQNPAFQYCKEHEQDAKKAMKLIPTESGSK